MMAVIGATFQVHLCQGEVVSFRAIQMENHEGCCADDTEDPSECCDDVQITLKIDKAQPASFYDFSFLASVILPTPSLYFVNNGAILPTQNINTALFPNPPPGLWADIPLFILHRNQKLDC